MCHRRDVNLKIRDGVVDLKELIEVSPEGLERWMPAVKARFPIDPAALAPLFQRLKIPPPAGDALLDEWQLLARIRSRVPAIDRIPVRKDRRIGTYAGCLVELTDVWFDGDPTWSWAVEHTDRELVLAVLREFRVSPNRNISYPRALQAFVERPDRRGRRQGGVIP